MASISHVGPIHIPTTAHVLNSLCCCHSPCGGTNLLPAPDFLYSFSLTHSAGCVSQADFTRKFWLSIQRASPPECLAGSGEQRWRPCLRYVPPWPFLKWGFMYFQPPGLPCNSSSPFLPLPLMCSPLLLCLGHRHLPHVFNRLDHDPAFQDENSDMVRGPHRALDPLTIQTFLRLSF